MEALRTDLNQIVDPDAQFVSIVSGFEFIEGPIWHPTEHTVTFNDILGNSIFRWSEKNGLETLRRNSYMANGNAYDRQGRVVTCEHATSRVTRTDFAKSDKLEVLAKQYQDKQLNSPNDVVVKNDGTIYFTDPTSGRSEGYGLPREPELSFSGVYRLDPETDSLTLLTDEFAKPNGLCFSEDESRLYVNDSTRQHIRVFDITDEGALENGRHFTDLPGDSPGVADGMKIDQEGNIFCCGPGGIHVFTQEARPLGLIPTPETAANFVFGGDDFRTIYLTASTSLYQLAVRIPGHPTFID